MHPNDQGFNEESGGDAPPSPEPFRLSITRRGMLWNNMRSHALNEGINPDDFPANRRRLRMSFISIVKSVETFVDVTRELPEFSRTLSNEDIDRIAMRTAQVENRSTGSKIKRILCNPLGAAAIAGILCSVGTLCLTLTAVNYGRPKLQIHPEEIRMLVQQYKELLAADTFEIEQRDDGVWRKMQDGSWKQIKVRVTDNRSNPPPPRSKANQ
jgi:hypothetical protein